MSTKAIRRVLDNLADERGERLVRAALAEVEAIEAAAAERISLAEEILKGDTGALDRLVQLTVDEADAAIARQGGEQ